MIGNSQYFGSYTTGGLTAALGTAITALIPPTYGDGNSPPMPFVMQASSGPGSSAVGTFGNSYYPAWQRGTGAAVTRLVSLNYTVGADAHTISILRPLNFTYLTAAIGHGVTAFPVAGDPGVYSTNYMYALPGGTGLASGPTGPSQVTNRAVVSGDYVAYQLLDGSWQLDTVASAVYSAGILTVNTGTPSPSVTANSGCYALSPVFLFGPLITLTLGTTSGGAPDPATGVNSPAYFTGTSATTQIIGNLYSGGVAGLHRGDPLLVVSNNITAAGMIQEVTAVYSRY